MALEVTEEFLRWLADHCVPSVHSEGMHGHIDGLAGSVGRAELKRREDERLRRERATLTGRDPDLVGDAPPGWRRNADGTWERADVQTPAVAEEPAGPPGWTRDADGTWAPKTEEAPA